MEALCRITLLEPYANPTTGKPDKSYQIPLGDGQESLIPMGSGQFNVGDPTMHVGFNKGQAEQLDALGIAHEQNQFKAAADVVYHLGYGKEQSILVTATCAQRWFGDWTVKPGDRTFQRVKRTYQQEKVRVAMAWGDYLRMPRGKRVQMANGVGVEPDTRIIGAPPVPKVRIEMITQQGSATGDAFDPWAFYKWELDIDQNAVREAKIIAQEMGYLAPTQIDPRIAFGGGAKPSTAEDFMSSLSPEERVRLAQLLADSLKGGNG